MNEIWKKVKDYENYEISNFGKVKRKNKVLKYFICKNGYKYVSLSKNGIVKKITIHSLVAINFLNHKNDGTNKIVIDHIDNDKLNNNLDNLQLITNRENNTKTKKGITSIYVGVRKNKGKFESQIRIGKDRKYLGRFNTELDAYKAYQKALNDIK